MRDKPLTVKQVSEEEVQSLAFGGPKSYAWQFPEETFNGDWWAIEIPNNKVSSASNSYRNQSHMVYGTKAAIKRSTDGRIFVKRLVDEPYVPSPSLQKKMGQKKRPPIRSVLSKLGSRPYPPIIWSAAHWGTPGQSGGGILWMSFLLS